MVNNENFIPQIISIVISHYNSPSPQGVNTIYWGESDGNADKGVNHSIYTYVLINIYPINGVELIPVYEVEHSFQVNYRLISHSFLWVWLGNSNSNTMCKHCI